MSTDEVTVPSERCDNTCPYCHDAIDVDDEADGHMAQCPGCELWWIWTCFADKDGELSFGFAISDECENTERLLGFVQTAERRVERLESVGRQALEVMEARRHLPGAAEHAALDTEEGDAAWWRAVAERLYQLLDDIDTAEDAAKGDLPRFERAVRRIHRQRFLYAESPDGRTLVWKGDAPVTPESVGASMARVLGAVLNPERRWVTTAWSSDPTS